MRTSVVGRPCSRAFAPAFKAVPALPRARVGRPARAPLGVRASLTVKDDQTGVEFLLAQKFWEGEPFRCLGTGTRSKKIVFVNVKVYTVAAYVEADRCAKELGLRERGGFFQSDDDYCQAVLDGAFNKILIVHLVRDIDGQQFTDAINKTLLPRMQLAGETAKLDEFSNFINAKKLSNNSEVVLFWNMVGDLEVLVTPPLTSPQEFDQVKPELRVRSAAMCRGLFEIFMGENSSVPEARASWVKGAKSLLDSDNVKRSSRKTGGG